MTFEVYMGQFYFNDPKLELILLNENKFLINFYRLIKMVT